MCGLRCLPLGSLTGRVYKNMFILVEIKGSEISINFISDLEEHLSLIRLYYTYHILVFCFCLHIIQFV